MSLRQEGRHGSSEKLYLQGEGLYLRQHILVLPPHCLQTEGNMVAYGPCPGKVPIPLCQKGDQPVRRADDPFLGGPIYQKGWENPGRQPPVSSSWLPTKLPTPQEPCSQ